MRMNFFALDCRQIVYGVKTVLAEKLLVCNAVLLYLQLYIPLQLFQREVHYNKALA